MNKQIINSHDTFFKELFSKKKQISEFVSKTLPPELIQNICLDSLEPDNTEYIDKKLQTSFSDIVYNCIYGNNTKIKISLLFEHKSYPEKFPHIQLLRYMLNIWQAQIKQKETLTPVIPIIFYHGKRKWIQKSFKQYFDNLDPLLCSFIPKFEYQIIDTSSYSDKQIKELFESVELQIGILIMKNIFNEQKLFNELTEIFAEINQILQTDQGEYFFETIVSYLFYATNLETQKIVEKMKTISPKAEEKFVSAAMRLKTEGIETGIKKVAFSMLKKNYKDNEILDLTGLSQEQLNYLKTLKEYQLDLESL